MKKNNIIKIVIQIILAMIIIGGGIYIWRNNSKAEPLTYSIANTPVSVEKDAAPFDFTAEELKLSAEECGTKHEEGHFDQLAAKFKGENKIVYNFTYKGDSQDSVIFTVTLLPNKAGYTSLDQFKKDFDICAVGGQAYPKMLNNNWLLFINSCGSGFDDGSGRIHGCDEAQKIIEPSLKLN